MVITYFDADCASNVDDWTSTTAYVIFLGGNPISWSTRKQQVVAHSSTKAEYHALVATASELGWLSSLFHELCLSLSQPPRILYDNVGATQLSLNSIHHSRMKHIAVDLHFVWDYVAKGLLTVSHVSSHD